jgi:hypothetical protein
LLSLAEGKKGNKDLTSEAKLKITCEAGLSKPRTIKNLKMSIETQPREA